MHEFKIESHTRNIIPKYSRSVKTPNFAGVTDLSIHFDNCVYESQVAVTVGKY